MEWKNGTLRSMLKGNKEKVIFLFCSGLLLFVISLPNGKTTDSGLRAGTVEVVADVSGDDESTALEDAGEEAAAKEESGSYEEKLEQRIRELLKSVDGVGEADVMVVLKSSEERIWHVDIPAILPTICIMLILRCGSVMTVGFEKTYLLQSDLNMTTSEVISTYVYKVGMGRSSDFSYGAAVGLFNSVVNCFFLVLVNWISKKISDKEVSLF